MSGSWKLFMTVLFFLSLVRCRKPYDPPEITVSSHILAVDGIIHTGSGISSRIVLTRSRSLQDSITDLPEIGAQVKIQSSDGSSYSLLDAGGKGIYQSSVLNLDPQLKYRLYVKTGEGHEYLSDETMPKISPPVDSLTWELVVDPTLATQAVNIYVNTHDPTNGTRFYRWDYIETWQYQSALESFWGLRNGFETGLFHYETTHNCWSTATSDYIILGTSIALSADVISHIKVASFAMNDPKMDIGYSILVRQYPLDASAYEYWVNVQKNSQSMGGLSDVMPSQLAGNIRPISNVSDPVVGYVSASSVQEKRLFISNRQLPHWQSNPGQSCPLKTIAPPDPNNVTYWNYPDTSYQLYYYSSGLMVITKKNCLDCRYQGGTTTRPDYWPPD